MYPPFQISKYATEKSWRKMARWLHQHKTELYR